MLELASSFQSLNMLKEKYSERRLFNKLSPSHRNFKGLILSIKDIVMLFSNFEVYHTMNINSEKVLEEYCKSLLN